MSKLGLNFCDVPDGHAIEIQYLDYPKNKRTFLKRSPAGEWINDKGYIVVGPRIYVNSIASHPFFVHRSFPEADWYKEITRDLRGLSKADWFFLDLLWPP